MLDGGGRAVPDGVVDDWLVTDERAELIAEIRRLARSRGLVARVASVEVNGTTLEALPVVHTSHPTYGYQIRAGGRRVVWAPEFWEFPTWAAGADVMFADAAAWDRPIRFAHGVGGHAPARDVATAAERLGVRRLVFAHLGRPTIRAMDAGLTPSFGELGVEGAVYVV
jgi:hypothetical protein